MSTTDEPTPADADGPARLDDFEAELRRLKVRSTTPDTEARLLVVGMVLMPLGLVLVLVGWFGASGTTDFSSQVPYLLSGGVLGLGLIVVGAALFLRYSLARYLRFWLLRLVYEERAASDRNVEALTALGDALARNANQTNAARPVREKEIQP
jgi:hypothetical protein